MAADPVDYTRLCSAVAAARRSLQRQRENRVDATREYAGENYSEDAADKPQPLNMLSTYVQVTSRQLISSNPRVMLSTDLLDAAATSTVKVLQRSTNVEIERQNMQETFGRVVVDAMFAIGIGYVSIATPATAALKGFRLRAGTPTFQVVDLDDFVCDVEAKRFDECEFMGRRYRASLKVIKRQFRRLKAVQELRPDYFRRYNQQGDERISAITAGYHTGDQSGVRDAVDLWEIYLPHDGLLCTFRDDGMGTPSGPDYDGKGVKPLWVQPWIGPEGGPYHFLSLGPPVPGNLFPKNPIGDVAYLNKALNASARKVIRQVLRLKVLTTHLKNQEDDAKAVNDASDGDSVGLNAPAAVGRLVTGGPDQGLVVAVDELRSLFNKQAGNLELQAGAAPASKTLGQDRMLNANSSGQIDFQQAAVTSFTSAVLKSFVWFEHHNPFKVIESTFTVPGLAGVGVVQRRTPAQRKTIPWEKLNVRVDPFSMREQTPESKAQAIQMVMTQIMIPLMGLLKEAGVVVDVQYFLRAMSELMNMPEIKQLATIQDVPQPTGGGDAEPEKPGMPANTSRTYERVSRPAGTEGANTNRLQTAMKQAETSRAQ